MLTARERVCGRAGGCRVSVLTWGDGKLQHKPATMYNGVGIGAGCTFLGELVQW